MKKYLRTIIASIIFFAFIAATILTYTSDDYVRARDKLEYLHSDMGQLSVSIEKSSNRFSNINDNTAYLEWQQAVEHTEEIIKGKETLCIIFAVFSLLSLAGVVVMFIQDKKTKSAC